MKKYTFYQTNELYTSLKKEGILLGDKDGNITSTCNLFSLQNLLSTEINNPQKGQVLMYWDRKWHNGSINSLSDRAGEIQINIDNEFKSFPEFTLLESNENIESTVNVDQINVNGLCINNGLKSVKGIQYAKSSSNGILQLDMYIKPETYKLFPFKTTKPMLKLEINDISSGIPHISYINDTIKIYNLHPTVPISGTVKIAYEMF